MKLTNDDMLAYVDGTLSPDRRVSVEAHLRSNPEDAELLREMQEAQLLLMDWHEAEPVRVSDDFWIKVREQLPPGGPPRNPLRRFGTALGAWLWPAHNPSGLSLRVGAIAVGLAMALFLFAPKHDAPVVIADNHRPTAADVTFMQTATRQHQAFATSPDPVMMPIAPGDASSQESGDDDDGNDTFTP